MVLLPVVIPAGFCCNHEEFTVAVYSLRLVDLSVAKKQQVFVK
jgi:hypothetical protein